MPILGILCSFPALHNPFSSAGRSSRRLLTAFARTQKRGIQYIEQRLDRRALRVQIEDGPSLQVVPSDVLVRGDDAPQLEPFLLQQSFFSLSSLSWDLEADIYAWHHIHCIPLSQFFLLK